MNDGQYGGCASDCSELAAHCGDGALDEVEACDDGNSQAYDGCTADCVLSGTILWEAQYDGASSEADAFYDLGLDDEGNVYAVGAARALSCNYSSGLIRKLSADGGVVATEVFIGEDEACEDVLAVGLAVIGEDDLVVVSQHGGAGAFDALSLLRRYSFEGESLVETWSVLDAELVVEPETLAAFGDGVLVAGEAAETSLSENGAWAHYDLDGVVVESGVVEGPNDVGLVSSVDSDSVGGYALAAIWGSNDDLSVRSFEGDGTLRWSRLLDEVDVNQNSDPGGALSYGPGNTLAVCSNAGDGTVYTRSYDEEGTLNWSGTLDFGEEAIGRCHGIAVDEATGDVVLVGLFDETASVGLATNGNTDAFVARYSSDGAMLWQQTLAGLAPSTEGGTDPTAAFAVAFSPSDTILVAGQIGAVDLAGDEFTDAIVWNLVP